MEYGLEVVLIIGVLNRTSSCFAFLGALQQSLVTLLISYTSRYHFFHTVLDSRLLPKASSSFSLLEGGARTRDCAIEILGLISLLSCPLADAFFAIVTLHLTLARSSEACLKVEFYLIHTIGG